MISISAPSETPSPGVLIHYHIYKNAGTSIDRLLEQNFPERLAHFEGKTGRDTLDSSEIAEFIANNGNFRAISSHRARPPLPVSNAYPILMLRHPIDRARSVYHFGRIDPNQPDHVVARESNFREYIDWSLNTSGAGVVIRNYQVIHLSDASFRSSDIQSANARENDLAQAKTLIDSFPAIGIVRLFAESCRLFENTYRPIFPSLKLYHVRDNISENGSLTETESIELARIELGETTYRKLINANEFDIELYQYAVDRLRSLISHIL